MDQRRLPGNAWRDSLLISSRPPDVNQVEAFLNKRVFCTT